MNEPNELQQRIDAATDLAYQFAGIDGAHHQRWVLDQMVRHLLGDEYAAWVARYDAEPDSEGQEWDPGIAP